jgi:hypothetical protein
MLLLLIYQLLLASKTRCRRERMTRINNVEEGMAVFNQHSPAQ